MHSVRLEQALAEFVHEAAAALHGEVQAGAEVPFEVDRAGAGPVRGRPALYCYRPLTGEFIAERMQALERLPAHADAARLLGGYGGLERYLTAAGAHGGRPRPAQVQVALSALLRDVFAEQSDFELHPERLRAALARLQRAAEPGAGEVLLLATLHGLTIASEEIRLTSGLAIAHPDGLEGLPEAARAGAGEVPGGHLVAILACEQEDPGEAVAVGSEVLRELLRALRLFGDGRVTLGALAWARTAEGAWSTLALGAGGRPHGMLVVTAEQEDELRAFCNLVSRRAPEGDELAWALRRFELGCERDSALEGLSDHLLALRALLEPEGRDSGMLAGRLAALCATPERRQELTERVVRALALERSVIEGTAAGRVGAEALARDIADHLRALLRDVVCGHLDADLCGLADEILLEDATPAQDAPAEDGQESVEDVFGDAGEAQEVLDFLV